MKYVANFPVTINHNRTISLFDTGATISCMSKSCFDKLQSLPKLIQTNACRINWANGNSLGLIIMTMCTLKFPKNFTNNSLFAKCTRTSYVRLSFLPLLFNRNILVLLQPATPKSSTEINCKIGPCIISLTCKPYLHTSTATHICHDSISSNHTTKNNGNNTQHIQWHTQA